MDAFDREEQILEEQLSEGTITLKEFNGEMRELRRDYAGAAQEAAEQAYQDEMGRW